MPGIFQKRYSFINLIAVQGIIIGKFPEGDEQEAGKNVTLSRIIFSRLYPLLSSLHIFISFSDFYFEIMSFQECVNVNSPFEIVFREG